MVVESGRVLSWSAPWIPLAIGRNPDGGGGRHADDKCRPREPKRGEGEPRHVLSTVRNGGFVTTEREDGGLRECPHA